VYLDLAALAWFLFCWVGYTRYARHAAASKDCLASVMHRHRRAWMRQMLVRSNRMADMSAISTLERNVTFFASSALLIIAGILTLLGYIDEAISLFNDLPLSVEQTRLQWEAKIFLLAVIFIYAFFKFTWSMRQVGFAAVLIGAAPEADPADAGEAEINSKADGAARVISNAAQHFNHGIRSYYFALAVLAWFVNPLLFFATAALVVLVLYRREFRSATLRTLAEQQPLDF
jgi:uncharacterized membrane protein